MTPGSLCTTPSEFRYQERIAYCERDVETQLKDSIIDIYEIEYGFSVTPQNRKQYKIDHYIPLCMGGSNNVDNLWPQQQRIYTITDPLEHELCQKLSSGKIKQSAAIDMIRKGKNNLELVPDLLSQVRSL